MFTHAVPGLQPIRSTIIILTITLFIF